MLVVCNAGAFSMCCFCIHVKECYALQEHLSHFPYRFNNKNVLPLLCFASYVCVANFLVRITAIYLTCV